MNAIFVLSQFPEIEIQKTDVEVNELGWLGCEVRIPAKTEACSDPAQNLEVAFFLVSSNIYKDRNHIEL